MPFDPVPSLQSFQHLLDRIAADPELTPKRRSELASAIRSFLKHTGGDATALAIGRPSAHGSSAAPGLGQ